MFYLILQLFTFSFKTLQELYKPLEDTKTYSMPSLIFTHHIVILFEKDMFFYLFKLGMILSTPLSFLTKYENNDNETEGVWFFLRVSQLTFNEIIVFCSLRFASY